MKDLPVLLKAGLEGTSPSCGWPFRGWLWRHCEMAFCGLATVNKPAKMVTSKDKALLQPRSANGLADVIQVIGTESTLSINLSTRPHQNIYKSRYSVPYLEWSPSMAAGAAVSEAGHRVLSIPCS